MERISASNVGNQDEENEDENFMVLDSVGSADGEFLRVHHFYSSNGSGDYSDENWNYWSIKKLTPPAGSLPFLIFFQFCLIFQKLTANFRSDHF